jgi:hypothetical protein
MPRRRTAAIEPSMFPFLSVLCVVIGILMLLMIVVISTRVIGSEAVQSAAVSARSDRYDRERQGPSIPDDRHQALSDEIQRLAEDLIRHQEQYRELRRLHAQLETLIEIKRDELSRIAGGGPSGSRTGRALGLPEKVKVVPDTKRKVLKRPLLVEVKAEGYVVHADETWDAHPATREYAVEELRQENSPLRKLIERVDGVCEKRYLLLLLHPNGVASYKKLRGYLDANFRGKRTVGKGFIVRSRIDIGVEPFSPDWLLMTEDEEAEDGSPSQAERAATAAAAFAPERGVDS